MKHGLLTLSLCLLVVGGPAAACDHDDADGLDVGLVLSGGGALATTHIGALAVIEEMGIPIHCVVGTSMGSVVGGLYAAGYDATALQDVFRDSRWPEVFAGQGSRRDEPYLQKQDDDRYLSGYLAGIGPEGLRLPAGFRSMSGLQMLFRQLLRAQPVPSDFDTLPTPFRAVAMDLSTGEPVALAQGDLVEAMLASMAVPGAFPPRHLDGRVLVDGGMAAQLPVSVAQAMGADLIIALDTTVEPPEASADWSVAQVSQQLIRHTVWRNWQAQRQRMGPDDVFIQPDIRGLSTSSFERAEIGFSRGIRAAQAEQAALGALRARAAPAPPRPDGPPPTPKPTLLLVDNASIIDDALLQKRLGFDGDELERPERLRRKLRDLAAFGPFGETDMALMDAQTALLRVRPLPLGRNLLSGGFRASNDFGGNSTYALLGQLARRPFRGNGGELRLSGELGTDLGLGVELHQPFGSESRFFAVPSMAYRGEELLLDFLGQRVGEFWQQTGEVRLRLGRELRDWGVIAVDGIASTVKTRTQVAIAPLPGSTTDHYRGGGVLFGIDTLDNNSWPSQGVELLARARRLTALGGDGGRTDTYRLQGIKPLRVGDLQLMLRLDLQGTDNEEDNPTDILRLGGFRHLTAFAENSLLTDRYTLGALEVYRRLNPSEALFSIPLYVGALVEAADVEFKLLAPEFDKSIYSYAAYLGTDTALGPFFLGAGFDTNGNRSLFMHFGRSF